MINERVSSLVDRGPTPLRRRGLLRQSVAAVCFRTLDNPGTMHEYSSVDPPSNFKLL